MKQLKMKDNQYRSKSEFGEVQAVVNCIVDKTLEQMERKGIFVFPELIKNSEDLTKDQMILQSFNDMYISGNVIGFLGVGKQQIVIESRFSKGENDYFCQYLLEKVLNFPNYINLETNANQNDKLFNLLLILFPRYLQEAMRKGIFKSYISKQYNDNNARGIINVDRHNRENTPFVGNVAYSQREYTYDNYLVELIRHTVEFIKSKSFGRTILNSVKEEVQQVVKATPNYRVGDRGKIINENRKRTIRHAYYHEYRALQQLCILILRNEKHQYGNGTSNVYGILFDAAWLWEEYMNMLLHDEFYHPQNKVRDGAQYLFEHKNGLIYPDFIGKNNEYRIIADAKYKPTNNIKNKDYLQVLAYMFRFDAKQGYYLYPEVDDMDAIQLRMNRGMTYEKNVTPRDDIFIVKCGLQIPENVKDYTDFVEKMKQNEDAFKKKIFKNLLR